MITTTMRGKKIDFNALMNKNATMPALGNARMNARGDIIGSTGVVLKKREDIAMEYHRAASKSVKRVALKDVGAEILSPAAAMEAMKAQQAAKQAAQAVLKTHVEADRAASGPNSKRKLIDD